MPLRMWPGVRRAGRQHCSCPRGLASVPRRRHGGLVLLLLPVTSWSTLAHAGFSAPGLIRLSAGVVQALYDPVEVGDYLSYPAEDHVIGDVDARHQGETDSDELRDDDVGDFDGRAGRGQA